MVGSWVISRSGVEEDRDISQNVREQNQKKLEALHWNCESSERRFKGNAGHSVWIGGRVLHNESHQGE